MASQEQEGCPVLQVEANPLRKVFRIQAGGTKRMKNVACRGGGEREEECNL